MWRSLLVFVFACLLYVNTLQNGFVLGDEKMTIDHPSTSQGIDGIKKHFANSYWRTHGIFYGQGYRPITSASFSLDYTFWNQSPYGYHLTNVLLFGILCLVLFLLLTKLQWLHPNLNLLLVLLFAAHPINSETVAHISYRPEILSFLFFAIALWLFDQYFDRKRWYYLIISLIFASLSFISKETTAAMLPMFPMLAWRRTESLKTGITSSLWFIIPAIFFGLLHFNYTGWFGKPLSPMENQLLEASSSEIWATKFGMWGKYLQLFFIPYPLRFDYSFNTIPLLNWSSSEIWTLFSFLVLSLVALITAFRKQSGAGFKMMFAFLFFVLALIPSSNPFFALPHSFSEHHVFIPSFGFLLFLFLSIQEFGWSEKAFTQRFWIISIAVCILMAASITFFRNQDWKSNESLLTADIKHLKSNALANTLLAALYHEKGYEAKTTGEKRTFYGSAIRLNEEAQEIHPSEQGYFELALLYGKTERYEGMLKACLLHIELTEAQGKSPSEAILILKAKAESKLDLQDT
jgi:protein O-mannosyl-transferase